MAQNTAANPFKEECYDRDPTNSKKCDFFRFLYSLIHTECQSALPLYVLVEFVTEMRVKGRRWCLNFSAYKFPHQFQWRSFAGRHWRT